MNTIYTHPFCVGDRDVDKTGNCKPSALLEHLQDAASMAGRVNRFGREEIFEKYHAFWMLARTWYRLERPLKWEEELSIRTWHRGGKGAMLYRDYDICCGDQRVGEAVSGWVLSNAETRRLVRLSTVEELQNSGCDQCKVIKLSKLRRPLDLAEVEQRPMRYSDTDVNGHVNNARYADFVCDALDLDGRETAGQVLTGMRLGYVAECRPGEILSIQVGTGEENGSFVFGLDEKGKTRFEAEAFFGKSLP